MGKFTRANGAAEGSGIAPEPSAATLAARRFATIAVMVATAMQAADTTIVNVGLPQLQRDLGGGLTLGAWVMTSYLCATAVVAPLTGWLRRRFGTQRLFGVSIAVFVAASLLCSVAPSAGAMILFRILQGIGGGVIHPLGQAILLDVYPKERHGRMLAILGATVMLGPVSGPALGGIITDLASWRWVFAINLPLGILAIWGVRRIALAETKTVPDQAIDFIGILLLIVGIGTLQLWLERSVRVDWLRSPELFSEAAIVVIAFILIAAGLGLLSLIPPVNGAAWIIAGSTLQAIGGGLLFTPLITIGLSTLPPELRTDATGLYSLLRQVGSASGLALMTGLLQVRIQAHLPALPAGAAGQPVPLPQHLVEQATLNAYAECFRVMVLAALAVTPAVMLFRIRSDESAIEPSAKPAPSPLVRAE